MSMISPAITAAPVHIRRCWFALLLCAVAVRCCWQWRQPAVGRSNHLNPDKLLFSTLDTKGVTEGMHL